MGRRRGCGLESGEGRPPGAAAKVVSPPALFKCNDYAPSLGLSVFGCSLSGSGGEGGGQAEVAFSGNSWGPNLFNGSRTPLIGLAVAGLEERGAEAQGRGSSFCTPESP